MCLMEKRGEKIWIKIGRGKKIQERRHAWNSGGREGRSISLDIWVSLISVGEEVSIRLSL